MAENNDPNKPRRQRQVPQPEEEYEWAGGIPGSQVPQTSNPLRSRPINVNDGYAGGIPGLSEIPSKSTSTTLQSRPSNVDDAHAGGSPSRQPEQQVKPSLPSPLSTTADVPSNYRATVHVWQVPLEDPVDLSVPVNFDESAHLIHWHGEVGHPMTDFIHKLQSDFSDFANNEVDPPYDASITLCKAYTAESRVMRQDLPVASPWFCLIRVSPDHRPRIQELHESIIEFVTNAFSMNSWFRVIVRYRIINDVAFSGTIKKEKVKKKRTPLPFVTPTEPKIGSPFATPPGVSWAVGPRQMVISDLIWARYREDKGYEATGPLVGARIGIHDSQGKYRVGTLAGFVTLKDKQGILLMREDGSNQPRIFAITSAHTFLVEGSKEEYDVAAIAKRVKKGEDLTVTHAADRDRRTTLTSRQRRMVASDKFLGTLQATLSDPTASADNKKFAEFLIEKVKATIAKDTTHARENRIYERKIGQVFLISGVRSRTFPMSAAGPLERAGKGQANLGSAANPMTVDYSLIEMDPRVADQCKNEISSNLYPFPTEYPEAFETWRFHRTITKLGTLMDDTEVDAKEPEQEPDEPINGRVVGKPGGMTGWTFGMTSKERESVSRGLGFETYDPVVRPIATGSLFGSHGDSGAPIINADGHWVGILSSGKTGDVQYPVAIMPMQCLRYDLKTKYGFEMELYRPSWKEPAVLDDQKITLVGAGANPVVHESKKDEAGVVSYRVVSSASSSARGDWVEATALDSAWDPAIRKHYQDVHDAYLEALQSDLGVADLTAGISRLKFT